MAAATLTIGAMIDRTLAHFGGPNGSTVDGVKAGDPSGAVTGVVTTFLATAAVIKEARAIGANLVFTHEPTFYNHLDAVDFLEHDPVYRAKHRLLEESGIVVCRLHDYPHGMGGTADWRAGPAARRDPFFQGIVQAMGWETYSDSEFPYFCTIPPTSLRALVERCKQRLHTPTVRVVGNLDAICRRVVLLVGAPGIQAQVQALSAFDGDVLITGECAEWELVEYARDATELGINRAMVAVGHQPSEEPGMALLAQWLRAWFPGIPITHRPGGYAVSTL